MFLSFSIFLCLVVAGLVLWIVFLKDDLRELVWERDDAEQSLEIYMELNRINLKTDQSLRKELANAREACEQWQGMHTEQAECIDFLVSHFGFAGQDAKAMWDSPPPDDETVEKQNSEKNSPADLAA